MGIVATASLVTAFLAGTAALFAPCCIGVLLPSYLASIFQTRTKVFLMTFVYYLGLLTVFLPLGIGIASLGSLFSDYHTVIFTVGGLFMVVLGISLLLGRAWMLPFHVSPTLDKSKGFWSFYILGIFSGIATSCCAPVLAGVMALTAMPGSWALGLAYSLAFVTGMVVPLFMVATVIDKTKLLGYFSTLKKKIRFNVLGYKVSVFVSHFISGILYILIGSFILTFERASPEAFSAGYQVDISLWTTGITRAVSQVTQGIPEWLWAIIFIAIFSLIAWHAYRQAKSEPDNKEQ